MLVQIFLAFSFLASASNAETDTVFDYCVGDLSLPYGPSGYSCKDPTKVTIDDFAYSGLGVAGDTTDNNFKLTINPAFQAQFPGLNGMGISMIRADLGVGGAVPFHTHRVAELTIVTKGKFITGFINTNNTVFYKTLNKGDIIIIRPGLQHFQVNVGPTPAAGYSSFPSANPGIEVFNYNLFESDLPSEIIQKVTLFDREQVKKLKEVFGGSN